MSPAAAAAAPVSPKLTDIPLTAATGGVHTSAAGAPITISRPTTAKFEAVGVSWTEDPAVKDVKVEFRTRMGAGAWTAWSSTETDDKEPDPADLAARKGVRGGTEPEWTGPATGVEATVTVVSGAAPRDLRLTLVDPGSSPADATPAVTTAAVGKPAIMTRAQWGADPKLMTWDPEYAPSIKGGFLHHTAGTNNYTSADVPAILRSIYAFHAQTRGWGDIGYNFLVDRFGRIWEGRAGGVDSTVIGAHTGGFNTGTFGVAMMGDFQSTAVPAATVKAVEAVFAWKFARWNVNPVGNVSYRSSGGGTSKYPAGTVVTKATISGHRDVGNTECPGDQGYAQLRPIRSAVQALIAAGGGGGGGAPALVSPAVSPASIAYKATTPVRITAGLSGSTAWTAVITRDCPAAPVRTLTGTGTSVSTSWDLKDSAGQPARPGSYTVRLYPQASPTGDAFTAHVSVLPPAATTPLLTGAMQTAGPAGFVPIEPFRVLDSRDDPLPAGGGTRLDVPVLGGGGVPATGVSAVVVSATGLCSTASGPLTLFPAGSARPGTSAVSVPAGNGTDSALAVVRVGAHGDVSVMGGSGSTDVALDVVGYLPTNRGDGLHTVPGTRVLDVVLAGGASRTVVLPTATVPAAASAVLANLAAVTPTGAGSIRVWPAGGTRPAPGSLIYAAGVTNSDRIAVDAGGGALVLENAGGAPVRVVLDVTGWYGGTGARFTAVTPTRITTPALGPNATVTVPVTGRAGVPAGATAVVASLSGRSSARTFLTAWDAGTQPGTADLHAEAGTWETNLVVLPLASNGTARLYNQAGTATATLDVVGWYR